MNLHVRNNHSCIIIIMTIMLSLFACGGEKMSADHPPITKEEPNTIIVKDPPKYVAPAYSGFGGNLQSQQAARVHLNINPSDRSQKIESFGASDAWSIQYVGNWKSAPQIADLLFSTDLDANNNPKGIGLSIWRFNIGAGSTEQNNIDDEWRRSETFLKKDGSYDWTKQRGQQTFLQLAKEKGVKHFVAFANSPPIHLTKNGNAFGNGGSTSNISPTNNDKYAQYLTDIWKHFADPSGANINFDYISPINEPQWDWAQSNGQEGSPYSNSEITTLVKALDKKINDHGLQTKIELPEAAQLNFFYETKDQRGNQLADFFSASSTNKVSQLKNVAPKIAGHSYFTTWPVSKLISTRQQLAQKLKSYPDVNFWMSEYCILEDNQEAAGTSKVRGIDPALYAARVIHHDLTIANASSWQWWLAVTPYNYNDGLIYVSKQESQGYKDSKMLWALGNFSRFVRPGMNRLNITRDDNQSLEQQAQSLMTSAYFDEQTKRVVVIFINYSRVDTTVNISINSVDNQPNYWVPYVTSESDNLTAYEAIEHDSTITIPGRSIVTLVGDN